MKLALGVSIWLCAVVAVAAGWTRTEQARARLGEVASYLASPQRTVTLALDQTTRLAPGDGLLWVVGEDARRVGEIVRLDSSRTATASVDPRYLDLFRQDTRCTYLGGAGSVWWSIQTLLPPSVQNRIRAECEQFVARYAQELRRELEPILVQAINEMATLLKDDLERVLMAHKDELRHLGKRYRHEIFEQDVLPLLREEIWPIMRRHGAGPAEIIGRELWQRLPLWGLTWRAAYDSVAHDTPQTTERRWLEFVRQEAMPILMSRMDLLLELTVDVIKDILQSPEVDATTRRILLKLKDDPEFTTLLQSVFRDLIRDNPRLEAYLRAKWEDEEVRRALGSAGARIEGLLHKVGDIVLLNDDRTGISPHLARVLRSVVLRKDRSYVIVQPGSGAPLTADGLIKLQHGD